MIEDNRSTNVGDFAGVVGASQTTVHKILKDDLYSFYIVRMQHLLEEEKRTTFCNRLFQQQQREHYVDKWNDLQLLLPTYLGT